MSGVRNSCALFAVALLALSCTAESARQLEQGLEQLQKATVVLELAAEQNPELKEAASVLSEAAGNLGRAAGAAADQGRGVSVGEGVAGLLGTLVVAGGALLRRNQKSDARKANLELEGRELRGKIAVLEAALARQISTPEGLVGLKPGPPGA